jgi:hypothetical protein
MNRYCTSILGYALCQAQLPLRLDALVIVSCLTRTSTEGLQAFQLWQSQTTTHEQVYR